MSATKQSSSSTLAGRLWLIAMGLTFIGMGVLIGCYLVAFFKNSSQTDHWIKTPAVITTSEIDDSQLTQHYATKYRIDVEYKYEFGGKKYTGDRIKRLDIQGSGQKKIKKKHAEYPVGLETTCIVNPDNPSEAFLEADTKASIYTIWFPGLFILGGAGMIFSAIFRKPKAGTAPPAKAAQ